MEEVNYEQKDLGDLVAVFQPAITTLFAGAFVAALLVLGGSALVWVPLNAADQAEWKLPLDVQKGWSWIAVGVACSIGVILIAGGAGVASYVKRLRAKRLEVFANGLRLSNRQGVEVVFWHQIKAIQETHSYVRPPMVKGFARWFVPEVRSTSYSVETKSGKKHIFDADSVPLIRTFGDFLKDRSDDLSLPWRSVEEHENQEPVLLHDRGPFETKQSSPPTNLRRFVKSASIVIGTVVLVFGVLAIKQFVIMDARQGGKEQREREQLQRDVEKTVEKVRQGQGGDALRRLMGVDKPQQPQK